MKINLIDTRFKTTLRTLQHGRIRYAGLAALGCLAFPGCNPSAPGDIGVTTGGQKDIAAARAAIERGEVPDPDAITVEGFLSEHSIPLELPDNPGLLYMTAATSWNRDYDEFSPLATIQVGFGTNVDRTTFRRAQQNLCLVIDRSASMADPVDDRSATSKLDAVRVAIDRMLSQLTINDRVSVVTFNDTASTRLEPVLGNDIAAIKSSIEGVEPKGGTILAVGLRRGYELLKANPVPGRLDRVILFTDALLTDSIEEQTLTFINIMENFAEDGIGTTIFGLGTEFGDEITYRLSQVRGANYYFLSDYERIVSVFDEEFKFLVSPIAFDVSLVIDVPFSFDVADVYGVPVEEDSVLPHTIELSIPALFLSNREGGGAIMARVRGGGLVNFSIENTVANLSLTYTDVDGQRVNHPPIVAKIPGGLDRDATTSYFETNSARRASLLLNTALVMKRACEDSFDRCSYYYYYYDCGSIDRARAAERLTGFLPYFDAEATLLEDRVDETSRSLSEERQLIEQLLAIVGGAPVGIE